MPAPSAVKMCTENTAALASGGADEFLLVCLVHLPGSAIRNRLDLHIRACGVPPRKPPDPPSHVAA